MADVINCVLCFFVIGITDKSITCGNPSCSAAMCMDCFEHLIQYSCHEKVLPTCPSQSCKEIYLYIDVAKARKDLTEQHKRASFDSFLKLNEDSLQKKILEQAIIHKIRAEKVRFLEESFPPAVSLVARIAFKHKLHKINEAKKDLVHMKISSNKRRCFYQSCNGFLDDQDNENSAPKLFVCMLCESNFCKFCEQDLSLDSQLVHQCREEDVQSLSLINGMVRCPGCNFPVFKDIGCDFITCSTCSTNFHYKTGEKTNHGSVNAKIQVAPELRLLSILYASVLGQRSLEILLSIEAFRPETVSKNIILRPVFSYLKKLNVNPDNRTKATHELELVRALDKYTLYKYSSKKYIQILSTIEKRLLASNMTPLETEMFLFDSLHLLDL